MKPFHPEELLARVEALLRRAGHRKWAGERVGEHLRLVPERRAAVWYGGEARLSEIEYRLLQLLLRNRGRVVTAQQLLTRVWEDGTAIGGDRVKFGVLWLRRKLREAAGPDAPDPIETVRGAGYRFVTAEEIDRKRDEGPAGQRRNTQENVLKRAEPSGSNLGQPRRNGSGNRVP